MIPTAFRRKVIQRADNRCEYCGLSQAGQEASFHIDHVVPIAKGGPTELENLALACVSCSLRKGAETQGIDPESKTNVPIFNPRTNSWAENFRWKDVELIGLSAIGRATIQQLNLNRPLILAIREEEKARHRHPPLRPI